MRPAWRSVVSLSVRRALMSVSEISDSVQRTWRISACANSLHAALGNGRRGRRRSHQQLRLGARAHPPLSHRSHPLHPVRPCASNRRWQPRCSGESDPASPRAGHVCPILALRFSHYRFSHCGSRALFSHLYSAWPRLAVVSASCPASPSKAHFHGGLGFECQVDEGLREFLV